MKNAAWVTEWIMGEVEAMRRVDQPVTRERLREDLVALGVEPGMTILVHTSLSQLGWVCGGAETVIRSLLDALGPKGTLMMPTHTADNTDPAFWKNPPVPVEWQEVIRGAMPPFDPLRTPSRHMGVVAELFRTWPGVLRSAHPVGSFAALGPKASELISSQLLESAFGEDSPLSQLYDSDGFVLLLGVGHDRNTSLHLSEHRATWAEKSLRTEGCSMLVDNVRKWLNYDILPYDSDDFERIGASFETAHSFRSGEVGAAQSRLISQPSIVDFAVKWIEENR